MLQQTLGYGARVYQAPELDPDSENGPIRRASGALVRNIEPSRMVYRSPHAVVPDAESAAVYDDPPLWTEKFLPDGRLVPMHAMAGAGAGASDLNPDGIPMLGVSAASNVGAWAAVATLAATGLAALTLTLIRK